MWEETIFTEEQLKTEWGIQPDNWLREMLLAQASTTGDIACARGKVDGYALATRRFEEVTIPREVKEAVRLERERISKEYEGEWYSVTDTFCPSYILEFRQSLKESK